jgi:decaprenylphospho-beta-D-ribofuranose 2-oxidase
MSASSCSLRSRAGWRVLDGFGRAVQGACRHVRPPLLDDLRAVMAEACEEGLSVAFRGAGRSYGDAALNTHGLVIDMTAMDRLLRWDAETGILEAEPGLTIEGLWRRVIEDGYWLPVVPGTMKPTLGGCVAMNVHGKNNTRAGAFGEHVLELDLLTPRGDLLTCNRTTHSEVFHAAVGGMGLLGAITRVKMQLKHVGSGVLAVDSLHARSLDEALDQCEANLGHSDYVVGWLDGFASGHRLGRGIIHVADYARPGEIPDWKDTLHVENQGLPPRILGFPKGNLWRVMRIFSNRPGMALLNSLKWRGARLGHAHYLQSLVGFSFLLDYVPDWRLAYGSTGFIQYQVFIPAAAARQCLRDVLRECQKARLPPYLAVLKRHRPDPFLLTHALDGWSLAMDFPVRPATSARLTCLTDSLTELVLAAGGKFYFAKDAILRPDQVLRAYGAERLAEFAALRRRVDPDGLLTTNLARRTGLEGRIS